MRFERLDFLYMPSRDVAAESDHFVEVLGGELVFRIEAFDVPGGHRLAIYELTRPEVPERFAGRRDF
jgi:hypothetical protein